MQKGCMHVGPSSVAFLGHSFGCVLIKIPRGNACSSVENHMQDCIHHRVQYKLPCHEELNQWTRKPHMPHAICTALCFGTLGALGH